PWARPAKAVELGGDFARQQAPELVDGGGEPHANYGSSPGMSGTFLLRSERGGTPELKGVLSQYNRYFRDSYFVSAAPVEKLADEFAAGKRG
ncbi:hypothetical protein, partial [Salmonella sp. 2019-SM259]|uniref:hypothetical protein n=1 Tax=Salmonella sp. 2019-SM259 TaxID=3068194 RepID=UPI0037704E49